MTERIDPTTLPGRPCPLASALHLVGDRWALLSVREVALGNHQFGQIARNTGAPTDRLSARLKDLVAAGVLERRANPDNPRYQGYHLTEAGRDLTGAMRELMAWGDRWAVTASPVRFWHGDHELRTRTVCVTCGDEAHGPEIHPESLVPTWNETGPVEDI
ncbi:winged helix-turn-helix transcriptional regulator [Streptomyces sp. 8L]|uniref:winged helix-turn-helix transcriptional regulator n=1 Tax=Streptomyces sp. 8L TaxID=2877242 RepID=UPI001CD70F4A|nr:helix-turn-helix domain-containing protein [Streptomyces sp. 8L]MCA1217522.1 helix-turn-helix transcriptional regulator [Streptomyces sp. 8L]